MQVPSEYPRIRRERTQIDQVGLVKHSLLILLSCNLNFHTQFQKAMITRFEE